MPDNKPHRTMGDIINEILISRGAPKEKYSHKVPTVKILWEPQKFSSLSVKEKEIISLLRKTLIDLESYNALSIEERYKNSEYKKLRKQHLTDIKSAVSAGLIGHPLVSNYVYTHKALGSKEILRKIKRGWETGVKRALTITDLRFRNNLEKIAEYRIEGKSWPQIRRILMQKKIIVKMTPEALRKKFKKAWKEAWKKVNKNPPPIP